MRKIKLIQPWIIGCIILSMLAGCSPAKLGATATPVPSSTLAPSLTFTPTIVPTSTATPTPTLVPTPTLIPTAMPTPLTDLAPAGASLRLSKGPLKFVDLSPDGKTVLVGGKITVCAYQVADGKETWCRTTGEAARSILRGLAYSPDGKTFLTGLENGLLILWDSASGKPLWVIPNVKLNTAAWSPDGQWMVVSAQNTYLRILDTKNGNTLSTIQLTGIPPAVLRWSPDGKTIAAGDDSGAITLWDPQSGQVLLTQEYFPDWYLVTGLAWLPDSKRLLAAASYVSCYSDCTPTVDGNLVEINTASGKAIWQVDVKGQIYSLSIRQVGDLVMARVSGDRVNLYSIGDGSLLKSMLMNEVLGAFWLPDGRNLVSINLSAELVQWDIAGTELTSLRMDGYYNLVDFAWSPDGSEIAGSPVDGPVAIWDRSSGKLLRTFAGGASDGPLAWSPNGKTIATFQGKQVILWDARSGQQEKILETPRSIGDHLAWSPDNQRLAGLSHSVDANGGWSSVITIWDTVTWEVYQSLAVPAGTGMGDLHTVDIAWSPDGTILAAAGGVYLWDTATGKKIEISRITNLSNAYSSICWSPDGSQLMTNDGFVFNLRDPSLNTYVIYWKNALGSFSSTAFSPDGKYLASGGEQIILHKPLDGAILYVLDGFANSPEALVFSPDSKTLASLSKADGTILLWKVP